PPDEILNDITARLEVPTYYLKVNKQKIDYKGEDEFGWWYIPLLATLVIIAATFFLSSDYSSGFVEWALKKDVNFIPVVSAERDLPAQNWKAYRVKAQDNKGIGIEVVIGVLWDPYRWTLGSISQVSVDEKDSIRYEVGELLMMLDPNESRPVIAVGTASRENAKEHLSLEEARAEARMKTLTNVCIDHFKVKNPHIYGLNLGAFNPDKSPAQFSASERRVILLVITKGEDRADLTSGIKNALIKAGEDNSFVFDARDYSIFNSDRFEVVKAR
ncbi:MAG: hypothetical protein KA368_23785, partial [Acidobacteria bacterium]|nr:hypothetical protein [Acidobacteriota bacterium]